jgi:pilus assembly protein Flp/PilA
MPKIIRFFRDDSAATAVEYGLIVAGIAVAIIAVVLSLGTQLDQSYQSVSDGLN